MKEAQKEAATDGACNGTQLQRRAQFTFMETLFECDHKMFLLSDSQDPL
jgi:hypothetical protein